MKYHRIKCNLYKAEGNSWEQMAEELLSSAVREERVVRLVLFTRCTDNQEYKFQRSFLEQWVERHFVSPRPGVSLVAQKPLVANLVLEVHSLVEAADEAVEAAVLVLAEEPPHAARAPAAPRMPAAFRNERREMQFFMIVSPCSHQFTLWQRLVRAAAFDGSNIEKYFHSVHTSFS